MKQQIKKLIHIIVSLFILVILVLSATYFLKGNRTQDIMSENKSTWKTYKNETSNFTIEYPEDWSVIETPYDITIAKNNDNKNFAINYENSGITYVPSLRIIIGTTKFNDVEKYVTDFNSYDEGVNPGIGIIKGLDIKGVSALWATHCGEGSFSQGPMFIKDNIIYDFRTPNPCWSISNNDELNLISKYIKIDSLYRPIFDRMIDSFEFIKIK